MKIKMKTIAAGPGGVLLAGQVYDVPDAMGQALVDGGYAEEGSGIGESGNQAIGKPAAETASVEAAETTTRPRAAAKRRGKAK